jgi:RND family efflux transporter MFP subunit
VHRHDKPLLRFKKSSAYLSTETFFWYHSEDMNSRCGTYLRHVASIAAIPTLTILFGCESQGNSTGANIAIPSSDVLPRAALQTPETFIGVVVGRYSADMTPRFDGSVREVQVRLGDRVKKNDLLALIDFPAARSELRLAMAGLRTVDIEKERTAVELEAAREQFSRRAALGKESLATNEDVATARYGQELARVRVESSQASSIEKRVRIEQLRKDVAAGELRAPFDGVISARYVDPGASVTSTTRIVRIISADDLLVRFAVPESNAHRLEIGLPVDVVVGDQKLRIQGKIDKIAPEVDSASRMIVVEATIGEDKSSSAVVAGLMAHVTIAGK